jgi:hypothetical protein
MASAPNVAGTSGSPFISAASNIARGPFVVYQSNQDIFGNGSSGFELFRFRVFHPVLVQYTHSPAGDTEHATISDGGGLIAVQSSSELLDPNPRRNPGTPFNADGNKEIFLLRSRNFAQQVTDTIGCENTRPSINGYLGEVIGFRSTCDLVPGHNPNGLPQLFIYRDVKKPEIAVLANCTLANGCCHDGTCYDKIVGKTRKMPKKHRARWDVP